MLLLKKSFQTIPSIIIFS